MPKRATDEEVEAIMVPQIVNALYPVLFPIEQQDCRIQAEHHARVTELARITWRAWSK